MESASTFCPLHCTSYLCVGGYTGIYQYPGWKKYWVLLHHPGLFEGTKGQAPWEALWMAACLLSLEGEVEDRVLEPDPFVVFLCGQVWDRQKLPNPLHKFTEG